MPERRTAFVCKVLACFIIGVAVVSETRAKEELPKLNQDIPTSENRKQL